MAESKVRIVATHSIQLNTPVLGLGPVSLLACHACHASYPRQAVFTKPKINVVEMRGVDSTA